MQMILISIPRSSINKYDQLLRYFLENNKKFIAIFDADGDLTKEKWKRKILAKKNDIEDVSEELKIEFLLFLVKLIFLLIILQQKVCLRMRIN